MALTQIETGIDLASRNIEKHLKSDSEFKSLAELLKASPANPTLSGLQDVDYPNILGVSRKIPLISNISTIPLPVEIVEQFSNMQQNCELGLFPEISRAWMTVDSNIFVWSYDSATDVAYYDGLDQTIVSVCLLHPKPGVFKPHIKYLLCLTTALEVTLLGVTFSDQEVGNSSTILLIPDPIFRIATDNSILSVVAGTNEGRIFLGGNDGCLYEIEYQAEEGWFSKNCRKVNHSSSIISYVLPSFLNFNEAQSITQIVIDDSRHLLFTLSDNHSIQLFDLGTDGQTMRQVVSRTWSSIVNQASSIARTIDSANFKPVISINALTRGESDKLNLVAVTQAGVRLYFSASGDRPSSLELVHVRLPPGFTPSSAMQKPQSVNNLYCKDSTYIMTSSQVEDKDFLWVISNDCYIYENQMMESFNVNSLGGKVWKIAEELRSGPIRYNEERNLPLVATQQYNEKRKFVLLTSQGVHLFYKHRPIDQLSRLLIENQGFESAPVRSFFQTNKLTEACLSCLILACTSKLPHEIHLTEWATLAFVRYGGEPKLADSLSKNHQSFSNSNQMNFINPQIMSNIYEEANPTYIQNNVSQVVFSAKHDALYLYLTRILRPIWYTKVTKFQSNNALNQECLTSSLSSEEVLIILKRLIELKRFLSSNSQINTDNRSNRIQAHIDLIDPAAKERESINLLTRLLNRCIEVLNLYQMLNEHEFSTVCSNISIEQQIKLSTVVFKDLIVAGGDITTMLASALVRMYLDDNITTDAISRKLHELCPNIFRQENALHAKAHEMVLKTRNILDKQERDRLMNEAVSLFKKIGTRLDLQAICDLLHSAKAYKHIVDICLYIAEKRDPQNLAGHYQKRPSNQTIDERDERNRAAVALQDRMECYNKIMETLERLLNSINSSIPSPINLSNGDESQLQISHKRLRDEAISSFDDVINATVNSSDELFHFKLYEWLCEHDLSAKLLDIQSQFIESFLDQKANSERAVTYLDLKWRYFERRGNRPKAALVLSELASKSTSEYDLHSRLEYLSRAIICMQSSGTSVIVTDRLHRITPGELLHDLNEKMEVARIQLQLLEKIKELTETHLTRDAISQLNFSLINLTQLHDNFAVKFALFDIQLAILKCAGHYDQCLIEKLWQNIVDNVLRDSSNESPEAQLLLLGNRITNLAQTLMPSERYIPAYLIVSYIEFKTHKFENHKWLVDVLSVIGFSHSTILDIYHKFYKSRENSTFWPKKSIHVLRIIGTFIEDYLTKLSGSQKKLDKTFAATCLDVICGYLIDLQSLVTTDREILKLLENYRVLQSQLNCLLS